MSLQQHNCEFSANVHQAHKELYVGWGNLTDFQFCIENFQFSMQCYDFYIMNFILCDDKFLWLILMIGGLQLRKWDLGIFLSHKLCWNEFSLKGVQCKQWDPGIACFWRKFTCWLDGSSQIFFAHEFMLQFSYMVDKFVSLWSVSA